jgi:hypothetical protein
LPSAFAIAKEAIAMEMEMEQPDHLPALEVEDEPFPDESVRSGRNVECGNTEY